MTKITILVLVRYRYRNRNPNWPILSADTVTNTQTTFQMKYLSVFNFKFLTQKNLKKSFGFEIKIFGSNTDTEIGPWFWFPIPKPSFGHTLTAARSYIASVSWKNTYLLLNYGAKIFMKQNSNLHTFYTINWPKLIPIV